MEDEYDANHRAVWPSGLDAIGQSGIRAYSMFRDGRDLFFYFKAEDFKRSMENLKADPEHTRWNKTYSYMFDSTANPTTGEGEQGLIPEVFRFEFRHGAK